MARYIDAERLKRTFASGIRVYDGMCKIADVMHNIENEPTADVVEVKHGKWIESFKNGCWYYDCPFCDDGFATKERCKTPPNYCGNCGAKMNLSEKLTGCGRKGAE